MKAKINWIRIIFIAGVVLTLVGALDPLEGSAVIALGSVLLALSTFLTRDHHWKLFLITMMLIIFGVFFLFYLSSLGGFGEKSGLSWWYGLLIIPYPIGWLTNIVLLIIRAVHKKRSTSTVLDSEK